jgi:hypothetical protein
LSDPTPDSGSGVDETGDWTPAFPGQREPFRPGNSSALKSGATSELALAPLRVALDLELAADYPTLDARRRTILADRLARLALAWRWLDEQPGIVRDDDGHVFDIADRVEKWASRAETILAELEAEQRESDRPQDIAAGLAALEAERKP